MANTAFDCLQSDTRLSPKEKRLMGYFLDNKGFDLHDFADWQYPALRRCFKIHQLYVNVDIADIARELRITREAHERETK